MTEDKFDNMYEGRFDALQKKYEAVYGFTFR